MPLDQRPASLIIERVRSLDLPRERLVLGVGSGAPAGGVDRVPGAVGALERELGVRVVVGALGPRMSTVAGEVAAGALFNWVTPEHVERAGRWVLDGARAAAVLVHRYWPTSAAACSPTPAAALWRSWPATTACRTSSATSSEWVWPATDTCVLATEAEALQAGIVRYERRLEETIVPAVTPSDSVDILLDLLHACAPRGLRADPP